MSQSTGLCGHQQPSLPLIQMKAQHPARFLAFLGLASALTCYKKLTKLTT
ncbi:hypothetical protein [Streptomyces europaeiscabiei]|nr:hypothetical protein [Streptomyces europaeiscabiei]MDX3776016.1 hypothetical protein [Streptomyces europaeiscabiei]